MKQLGFDFAARAEPSGQSPAPEPKRAPTAPAARPPAWLPPAAGERLVTMRRRQERTYVLRSRLRELMGTRIELFVTDNKRRMISSKPKRGYLEVRLHHMFLEAGDDVVETLARYLSHRGRADGELIDAFIAAHKHLIDEGPRQRLRLQPQGRVYDLSELLDELRPSFPEDMSALRITWGRYPTARRRQRSLQLGAYTARDALIRIHRVLDQAWVPRWYVASVVFHEMLHHAMPAKTVGGKRRHHSKEFRERERRFAHYEAACAWEEANLPRLLASIKRLPRW